MGKGDKRLLEFPFVRLKTTTISLELSESGLKNVMLKNIIYPLAFKMYLLERTNDPFSFVRSKRSWSPTLSFDVVE